ncbi:hypothetical protein TTHERM_002653389, partial (macronuclear) [Tetrahymena thermophila SB210]
NFTKHNLNYKFKQSIVIFFALFIYQNIKHFNINNSLQTFIFISQNIKHILLYYINKRVILSSYSRPTSNFLHPQQQVIFLKFLQLYDFQSTFKFKIDSNQYFTMIFYEKINAELTFIFKIDCNQLIFQNDF